MAIPTALHAALLLARGDPSGLEPLNPPAVPGASNSMLSAPGSFWAMAVALPPFLLLHLLQSDVADRPDLAHDLLGYVIGWLGFVLLSHAIAGWSGRRALWPRYIAAWNWCSVVQYGVVLVAEMIVGSDLLPDFVAQTLWLVAIGWALWLEWFLARTALDFGRWQAIGLVALSYLIASVLALEGFG